MWRHIHYVSEDPGPSGFARDALPALEKPEGGGVFGTNTPNVVPLLPAGCGFRLYYTLIGPTADNPDGCNDYTSATSEIRSQQSMETSIATPAATSPAKQAVAATAMPSSRGIGAAGIGGATRPQPRRGRALGWSMSYHWPSSACIADEMAMMRSCRGW